MISSRYHIQWLTSWCMYFSFQPFNRNSHHHNRPTCHISKVNDPPSSRAGKVENRLDCRFADRSFHDLERWRNKSYSWPSHDWHDHFQYQQCHLRRDLIAGSWLPSVLRWRLAYSKEPDEAPAPDVVQAPV